MQQAFDSTRIGPRLRVEPHLLRESCSPHVDAPAGKKNAAPDGINKSHPDRKVGIRPFKAHVQRLPHGCARVAENRNKKTQHTRAQSLSQARIAGAMHVGALKGRIPTLWSEWLLFIPSGAAFFLPTGASTCGEQFSRSKCGSTRNLCPILVLSKACCSSPRSK